MLLYRNSLATISAPTGKSYLPVRKINMFVDIGVKVRGLVAEPSRLFSAPQYKISKLGEILPFEKYISEKSLHLYLERKIEKRHSKNIDF